ncbi:DUF1580 domain-containing protein [Limnoglobus roseus]|uniref:Uncharacterized protein n=1 Tax=Limnoglobus roseus TaxID=2598579 RepID=A0A5C1AQJ7_9BACT|nr:DUF1580 domain-containing protein [Limnoglobus roseus]QEL19128.1 hypothetical protein PX52LOC_06186 [Limnoglobus roseus]
MQTTTTIETLRAEGFVTLSRAARAFHMSPASLSRWCNRGATAPDGVRVHLEHARTPGRVMTSIKAVERFLTAITGTPAVVGVPSRSPSERQRASEEAARQLKAMGI